MTVRLATYFSYLFRVALRFSASTGALQAINQLYFTPDLRHFKWKTARAGEMTARLTNQLTSYKRAMERQLKSMDNAVKLKTYDVL